MIAFIGGAVLGHIMGGNGGSSSEGDSLAALDSQAADVDGVGAIIGEVERVKVPVTEDQPIKGANDALVTIVEISDFECPFCSRVNPTIKQIMDTYGDKVRVVWRNNPLPFHKNAPLAHQAAMEAFDQKGSEGFWQYHDKLFANQKALTRENLEKWAQEIGLNAAEFKQALDSGEHKSKIDADQALASKIGARGTPHFVINGRKLSGAQPFDKFKTVIDEEVASAEKLLAKGATRAQLYATFQKNAKDAPAPEEPAAGARPQPDPKAVYNVPVTSDLPSKGSKDALITIVEVSDFECPFCSRVNPTIKQIMDTYGKDVRVVWYNNPLPFHKNAPLAHQAALEVHAQKGDAAFWKYHDKLFENQKALTRENLEKWAQELGVNLPKFKAALDTQKHKATIDKQQQLAASRGARGTPAFFINGRFLSGAQPFPAFKAIIDEEMTKAKKMVADGTPRGQVYAKIVADGATSPKMLPGAAPAEAPKPQFYEIPVPKDAPSKGARNAKVVIQEFSDFECPFCSRVNPTMKQVMDEYGDKVKIVWRNYPLPFHKSAPLAHQAAWEIYKQKGDAAFWKYHDLLFANQKGLTRENLEKWAEQIGGVNMGAFKSALDTQKHKKRMDEDMAAVTKAGARIGTPSFFVNGKLVQGAQPFPAFKAAIDEALAK